MIRDTETDEVVEDYKLGDEDWYTYDYSKLLNKGSKFNYKYAKDYNIFLEPYSRIFIHNFQYDSFNNKKFSII